MKSSIRNKINLARNMGFRYVRFRIMHKIKQRTGRLKRKFPVEPPVAEFIKLEEWKRLNVNFFFKDKSTLVFPKNPSDKLKDWFNNYQQGKLVFFGNTLFDLGNDYDWVTNPETGYKYDKRLHWTEIADFSEEAGDIKYVWEKSRFSFLYNIIRYDYHFNVDCADRVFEEIFSWIDENAVNRGPNYRCSQEISLRILNWSFALNYYKNHPALTAPIFEKVMHSIYWQAKHVNDNINFSRIAVRNNHAITETMGLYLVGILYPFFPEAAEWKKDGKKWFEEEIAYQVYPDGTFLQFSMNYHRVVIQLFTWAIRLSELNNEVLDEITRQRAIGSFHFLFNCMNLKNGHLPNYGANDGALFFPLNNDDFRDYRPQLQALSSLLDLDKIEENNEDQYWYGLNEKGMPIAVQPIGAQAYPVSGYYLLREKDSFSFIRCGNHKDRPSQADNLHLDIWVNDINILTDGGSYKYNADADSINYFFGSASHNSIMLGDYDQMKKGERFIWYYWTQSIYAGWTEHQDRYEFKGAIKAFKHVDDGIVHTRTVNKYKDQLKWEVIDEVDHNTGLQIHQIWHRVSSNKLQIKFTASDANGNMVPVIKSNGWHSPEYGVKEQSEMLTLSTTAKRIHTVIEITMVN